MLAVKVVLCDEEDARAFDGGFYALLTRRIERRRIKRRSRAAIGVEKGVWPVRGAGGFDDSDSGASMMSNRSDYAATSSVLGPPKSAFSSSGTALERKANPEDFISRL